MSFPATAHINAIGVAIPANEVHSAFLSWAERRIADPREQALFRRMAGRSGIDRRWSVLSPSEGAASAIEPGGFYADADLPSTAARMAVYAEAAPALALAAIGDLGADLSGVTHLVVASCTGFVAPGIDQIIARALGLSGSVERTLVGFMGCYAAVAALRVAHHLVRSEPAARVLVVNVELSSLHLQPDMTIEPLLAQLQFGDGAAAALVTAEPRGLALERFFAATLPDSDALIRWRIGDQGFVMHLSGEVPQRIAQALADPELRAAILGDDAPTQWAVHAGGRSILDAVQHGFALDPNALDDSRRVLADHGNMSSATLMFVLRRIMDRGKAGAGIGLAFGPGLAAEGFAFRALP